MGSGVVIHQRTRKLAQISLIALALSSLAACGGGGGGGVGSTPTPPPAPTPPTPPPPPPPPPAAPNSNLINLTSSENFTNDASASSVTVDIAGPDTASGSLSTMTVAYDVSSRGYTLTVAGRSVTFLPSDISAADSNSGVTVYKKVNGNTTDALTLTKPGTSGRFTFEYVGAGFLERQVRSGNRITGNFDAFTYGVATGAGAVPRTGRAEYQVDLIGVETLTDNIVAMTGSGVMQVDFQNGVIVTHGTMGTALTPPNGVFSSEARISATGNGFDGNFRFFDFGEFTGQLKGRFYGPAAQEIGATYYATQADGRIATGTLIGRGSSVASVNPDLKALTVNQFFAGSSATLNTTLAGVSGFNNGSEAFTGSGNTAGSLIVNYDAASRAYTVISPTRSQYFLGNRDRGTIRESLSGTTPVNDLDGFPYSTFTGLKYAASSRWLTATGNGPNTQYQIEDFIFGLRTPDAAVPRTGTASYAIGVSGVAADSDFVNLALISGFGALNANLATGALTLNGQIKATEDYNIAGRARQVRGGTFSGSGTISSSANSFSGSFNFDGLGTYTGTMAGAFFGPGAEEVAATWRASDGSGFAAGTFVGGKDASVGTSTLGILQLTAPTNLTFFEDDSTHRLGAITRVNYDPATQTYTLTLQDRGLSTPPIATVALSGATRDAANSTTSFDAHSGSISINRGQGAETFNYTARLLNLGATNPTITLTYSGLGSFVMPVDTLRNFTDRHYFAYGVPTPSFAVPRSGSATYSGIALGTGSVEVRQGGNSTQSFFDLTGTNQFMANFANGSFTSTLSLRGTNQATSATTSFSPYVFNGSISRNGFTTAQNGRTMIGSFFGPNAEEMGAWFEIFDAVIGAGPGDTTLTDFYGAVVGKKCPTAAPC